MLTTPSIVELPAQPCAVIRLDVPQREIATTAPPVVEVVESWLRERNLQPSGPCFFNYVGMHGDAMAMEIGWPVAAPVTGDGKVIAAELPAGRYAKVVWTGPYDRLYDVHMQLGDWIAAQGHRLHETPSARGFAGGTRLEIYITDPATTPNPADFVTEVLFRIAD